jgi:hypothetical protein
LEKISKILPKNTPKIINITKDSNGKIISYEMEKVNAKTLLEYPPEKLTFNDMINLYNIF